MSAENKRLLMAIGKAFLIFSLSMLSSNNEIVVWLLSLLAQGMIFITLIPDIQWLCANINEGKSQ